MMDLIHGGTLLWDLLITLYLVYRAVRRRGLSKVLSDRHAVLATLRGRKAELEPLLETLTTGTPEERVEAARAIIRARAAR